MKVGNRTDHELATSLSLLAVVSVVFAACLSIPGDPEGPQDPDCVKHAVFGDPAESPCVLPYPVGLTYEVFQTYCGPVSHGKDGQMSIDFLMPPGSEIVAARAGTVRIAIDHYKDFGRQFNIIFIEHEDGTSAFYGHLQENGLKVEVGEKVDAGQLIALSGSSGTSLEHLHFGVASSWPVSRPDDLAVNFRNGWGELDERGGLQRGVAYLARPYEE